MRVERYSVAKAENIFRRLVQEKNDGEKNKINLSANLNFKMYQTLKKAGLKAENQEES
jgi:hypothetical protein